MLYFLFLSFFSNVTAQRFPVQVFPRVVPPAPVNFYNYADGSTLNSPLQVLLLLGDLSINRRQIRLKVYFEGNGIAFESIDNVTGAPVLLIDGGTPLYLTNVELAPYFELPNLRGISSRVYGRTIPEGSYQFCFEVFDLITGNKLGDKTCATTFIFKNEPPLLNLPLQDAILEPKAVENIVFQWTPRHINVSNVEYELSLVEIWDERVDPRTAFLSSPPVFQTTTRATSFVYGPAQPPLLNDKRYAWQVKAKAIKGAEEIGLFKNEGKSEIYWFSKTEPCVMPTGVYGEPKGLSRMNIFWDEDLTVYNEYEITYREKGKANARWFSKRTNAGWATVWDLKPNTTYEFKLRGKCKFGYSPYTKTQSITTEAAEDKTANYNCGIVPDAIAITNREGHPNILIGDRITAGDFIVTITDITSEQDGVISGSGFVRVPYLEQARFGVTFNNILVNTDYQLAKGEIVTLYDPVFGEGEEMIVNLPVTEWLENIRGVINNNRNKVHEALVNGNITQEEADELEEQIEEQEQLKEEIEEELTKGDDADKEKVREARESTEKITEQIGQKLNSAQTNSANISSVVIQYKGQNYKHTDTINIPFNRNLGKQLFKIIGIKEEAKVDWAFYTNLDVKEASSSLGNGKAIEVNLIKDYGDNLVLGAEYWKSEDDFPEGKSKEVRVFIKVVKEPFELVELIATHKDKPKRIAKSGETLYLIDPPSATDTKKEVVYNIEIESELPKEQIDNSNIQWFYDKPGTSSYSPKNEGEKIITRNLVENSDKINTAVKGGYSEVLEKNVDVQWVKENKQKIKVVPPSIQNTINTVFKNMKRLNEITEKFGKYKLKIEPKIEFFGSEFNQEDEISRFYNIIRDGGINASLDLKYKVPLPPPYSIDLTIPWIDYSIGEIGAYIDIIASLKTSGILRYQKRSDQKTFNIVMNTIAIKGEGGLEFGAKANVLPEVELVTINLKAYGKSKLSVSGKVNFTTSNNTNFKPEIYLEPLIGGFNGEIKTGDYIIFKDTFEKQLSQRIKIYP
ncbi:fibronectin type III domain-containing protein [Aquimarina sp. ERC-38]|uniref:fibronectin type III domain-containing protein n=1 Tax=Aquimarina sp. ERC-38 TaxID=2949996 RepID=UPI00224764E0|nr:fibronectin type III domain-containing protein [Aquimarina sp. ERC-38]UZO79834.1 fibronectin type III domain-containing protein [Aquimarina sp. ERC-38]